MTGTVSSSAKLVRGLWCGQEAFWPYGVNAAMRIIARFGWCILCLFLCAGRATAEGVRHFVFFNRDRERIADAAFLGTKAFAGAQLKYTWRELEHAGTVLLKAVDPVSCGAKVSTTISLWIALPAATNRRRSG